MAIQATGRAMGAGLAGAVALTVAHETARRVRSDAPRMDRLGGAALKRLLGATGLPAPRGRALYAATMAGDLLSNGLYYGTLLLARPRHPFGRQLAGGLLAGVGALLLPPVLGLGRPPRSHRSSNRWMTVGLYLLGGLTAASCYRLLAGARSATPG